MIENDLALFQELATTLLSEERERGVAPYIPASEIEQYVDVGLQDESMSDDQFKVSVEGLLKYTPKTCTNQFFNQLFGGRHGKAIVGELLASMLNNSMYTYKAGRPMIRVEQAILKELKKLIAYPDNAGGTIATGGSMTNFMAILMARDTLHPSIKDTGVSQGLVAYTSEESHYSVTKNASFAGIGKKNVRKIACDDHGRMMPEALRNAIQADIKAGLKPFFVNATAGTTVLGSFDPLREIAGVCKETGVWLHVDGAYGGSVAFSDKYSHLIDGSELADSFSINAHKMLGVPLTCSFILTRHKKAMYDSFNVTANYLFQTDADEMNPGKISLQCGRRNDALKFWTLWKSIGSNGLRDMVEHQFHLADIARDYIRNHPDYTLYHEGPSVNVCFNYKGVPANTLCNNLYESSELMVGYGSFRSQQFVRFTTTNAGNKESDILDFFKQLEQFANSNFN